MPRKCTVCTHPKHEAIDRALRRGDAKRTIATRYGLSHQAVIRHARNHLLLISSAKKGTQGKHPGGRPRKFKTVAQMEEGIEGYFVKCDARVVSRVVTKGTGKALIKVPMPETYTVQGLAVFLDLTVQGLELYETREEFIGTLKKARARIEADKVTHLLDGDGYGPGRIFDLKNNNGWKDKREIENTGEVNLHFDREDAGL